MHLHRLDEEIKRRRHEDNQKKRRQWEAIKLETPLIASFLLTINRAFGKPAKVKVTTGNGAVICDS